MVTSPAIRPSAPRTAARWVRLPRIAVRTSAGEAPEGAWMAEHAWEHGFVMSYPADAQAESCFAYEPWHYRWIGREAAARQRAAGVGLREFLERYAVP